MFIVIDTDTTFAPVAYPIDTPEQERRARIALAAAGLDWARVWFPDPITKQAYVTRRRFFSDVEDDEVTAVYTPSPELLRAAARPVTP